MFLYSEQVSQKQLILLVEILENTLQQKNIDMQKIWEEISFALNKEGPCVKTSINWNMVCVLV